MYYLGIDPGYRKLGFCFMEMNTLVGKMYVIDIATWNDDKKHVLRERDFPQLLLSLIMTEFDDMIRKTKRVFIERQPGIGAKKVRNVGLILESMIMGRYAETTSVYVVDSKSVKYFFGIQSDDYDERKQMCLDAGVAEPEVINIIVSEFTLKMSARSPSEVCVDGFEGAMLCLYGLANLAKERAMQCIKNPGFKFKSCVAQFHQTTITEEQRVINKQLRLEKRALAKAAKVAKPKRTKAEPKPKAKRTKAEPNPKVKRAKAEPKPKSVKPRTKRAKITKSE